MLLLMFLSLPVFDDPTPGNYVWRGGELFNIDVGDGIIVEERLPNGKPQHSIGPASCTTSPAHSTMVPI